MALEEGQKITMQLWDITIGKKIIIMAGTGRISSLHLIIACISILSLAAFYISAFGAVVVGVMDSPLHGSILKCVGHTYTSRDPTPKSGWVPDLTFENLLCSYHNEEDIASFMVSCAAVNADLI
jgi:hypothetical protein